jgi:hypothetical protein
MGRGAAGLIPIIKETGGNIEDFTKKAKALGNALTDEDLKKVHEYEDAWISFIEHLKIKVVEGVSALDEFKKHAEEAFAADTSTIWGTSSRERKSGSVSTKNPGTIVDWEQFGPMPRQDAKNDAKGSNADLLTPAKDSQLKQYIKDLQLETTAIGESAKALAVQKDVIEATAKAKTDYDNGLRASKELTDDERLRIIGLASSYYDLKKAQEDNARVAKQMKDAISNSLADIAVNFKSLKDTATNTIQSIAKEIIKLKITEPLARSFTDALPSFNLSSIASFLPHFAAGGDISGPSVVGENGPEIFVPPSSGTIIPNHALGGQSVNVYQTFSLNPGATEQTVAQLRNLAPAIAAQAHQSVINALQKGGSESRIANLRN